MKIIITLACILSSASFADSNLYYQREYERAQYDEHYRLDDLECFHNEEEADEFLKQQSVSLNQKLVLSDLSFASVAIFGGWAASKMLRCLPPAFANGVMGGGGMLGALALAIPFFSGGTNFLFSSGASIFTFLLLRYDLDYWAPRDAITPLEVQLLLSKCTLPTSISSFAAQKFFEIRKSSEFDSKQSEGSMAILRMLLNFPRSAKLVQINETKVEEFKKRYANITDPLLRIARQYQLEMKYPSRKYLAKKSIFLVGPPGVGKTSIAKEMAEWMDLPFCVIKLEGKRPEDITGRSNALADSAIVNEASLGEIGRCFAESSYTNPVLIFDDVDRQFDSAYLSLFLTLIDPDVESNQHPILGKVDLSKLIVIFTGNFNLKTERTEHSREMDAILQRFSGVFKLEGYTREYKESYLKIVLLPELLALYGADKKLDYSAIVDRAIADSTDPGMRVVIQNFRAYLAEHLEELSPNKN